MIHSTVSFVRGVPVTLVLALILPGCSSTIDGSSRPPNMEITEISSISGAFCEGFSPTQERLQLFWREKEPLTHERWQSEYDWYPCSALGAVTEGGRIYQFEINAGGSGYVWQENGGESLVGCRACVDEFGVNK